MITNLNAGPWLTLQEERRQRQKLKEERRHRFEKFYAGWDAFTQDRSPTLPAEAGWPPADRDLYHQGHAAASLAAERFRNGT